MFRYGLRLIKPATLTRMTHEGLNVKDWPSFQKMLSPELKSLVSYFDKHQFEIRIAGGAVRDLISGQEEVHDVDLATTATPDEMLEMFKQEGVRTINELGLKHGTVTARIVLDPMERPQVLKDR